MNFSFTIALSDADKTWIAAHVVAPIVAALVGVQNSIINQQEALKGFTDLKAMSDAIDSPKNP
jgi:hypothetical protein